MKQPVLKVAFETIRWEFSSEKNLFDDALENGSSLRIDGLAPQSKHAKCFSSLKRLIFQIETSSDNFCSAQLKDGGSSVTR